MVRSKPSPQQPAADDPFFRLTTTSEWNACVGPQGAEENYVDGYIEAALELAGAVIDKKMHAKRDTLVMPILYNARHAIELALKLSIDRLQEMGVLKNAHAKDHDILTHWKSLADSPLGDAALSKHVAALKPYVESLSLIDDDGQALRYAVRTDGETSLAERPLANIAVIRSSLEGLHKTLQNLQHRLEELRQERATGSYTAECSRSDLLEIARMLPPRTQWTGPIFGEVKAAVRSRFGLSNRKFSAAIRIVEANREMRLLIGLESTLAHLTDQDARFVVEQWSKRHPPAPPGSEPRVVLASERFWGDMQGICKQWRRSMLPLQLH